MRTLVSIAVSCSSTVALGASFYSLPDGQVAVDGQVPATQTEHASLPVEPRMCG